MRTLRNYLLGLAIILTIVVVAQNTETVETRVLFITIAMPRALLLLATLAIGGLGGLVLGRRYRISPRAEG